MGSLLKTAGASHRRITGSDGGHPYLSALAWAEETSTKFASGPAGEECARQRDLPLQNIASHSFRPKWLGASCRSARGESGTTDSTVGRLQGCRPDRRSRVSDHAEVEKFLKFCCQQRCDKNISGFAKYGSLFRILLDPPTALRLICFQPAFDTEPRLVRSEGVQQTWIRGLF